MIRIGSGPVFVASEFLGLFRVGRPQKPSDFYQQVSGSVSWGHFMGSSKNSAASIELSNSSCVVVSAVILF